MSWHHEDYIGFISAVGGLASAVFAWLSTRQARLATQISKKTIEESIRQNNNLQLKDELYRLAERSNTVINEDSLVRENYASLVEMATALTLARQALEESTLEIKDKKELASFFRRHLRPGIVGEIKKPNSLMKVPDAFTNDILRQQYRDAQIFLSIHNPTHIPDPNIAGK
ncbi:hypothetical protein J3D56_003911 [Erwinia persicina]|uniref:hypothetical protein n=1 Tax=Erwinia persicina TaxID=55211 RepID=UPI00209ED40E|nr:hypothetical protein [Erwinia persicina]MCP1440475.1 hypothetical protein [Erwinia persicina]